jgi:hypothetical protein
MEVRRDGNQPVSVILYGRSGREYEVQALSNLAGPARWIPQGTVTLTNSFEILTLPDNADPSGFYRIEEK